MLALLVGGAGKDHPVWQELDKEGAETLHAVVAETTTKSKPGSSAKRKKRKKALVSFKPSS